MNILYSVPFWPYLYTPWLFREISWMRQRGHGVSVIALNDPPGAKADLKPFGLDDIPTLNLRWPYPGDRKTLGNLLGLGVGMASVPADKSLSDYRSTRGLRQGVHEWTLVKRAVKFARENDVDLVDAQWASAGAELAVRIKEAIGLPFTVTMQGGDLYRSPSPNLPRIVANADAVCPVSRFMADLLLHKIEPVTGAVIPQCEIDPERLFVRFNSVPSDILPHEPVEQCDDRVVVGTVGRADPEKHHADLINAVADLAGDLPQLHLRIIGGGALEQDLRDLIKQRNVEDRVEITGTCDGHQVLEYIKDLHVYVQAAEVEGCSFAALEATGQGMPIIATRTGAYEDLVDVEGESPNGFIFDAGDVDTLRDHLRVIANDRNLRERMGRSSLGIVRNGFSSDSRWTRVERLYETVIAR